MPFDFPASPTSGQTFTPSGGPTYVWNGYAWDVVGPAGGAPLQVEVRQAPFDYFFEPQYQKKVWEVYRSVTAFDGTVFRMMSYRLAAWFDPERRIALGMQ